MARQERPVDPAAGPVQALAYDLRKLRAEAGNPTYRALARTAGYSATTLSEAAGGTRLPTLEVLLAYVGACGGNPDGWRRRWHEAVDATGTGHVDTTGRGTGHVDTTGRGTGHVDTTGRQHTDPGHDDHSPAPEPVGPAGGPAPERPHPRRWRSSGPATVAVAAVAVAVAVVVAVVVATVVGVIRRDDAPTTSPSTGASSCPRVPADVAFTGTTYGSGAHVRGGARRDAPVLTTIPTDCTVGFTGFCVGEKVYDNTGGTPDVRWFTVAGGGVVSSAVIHGNPPRGLRAAGCPDGRPTPSALDFTVVAADRSGVLTLRVTGTGLDVAGFTFSPEGASAWRQVGLVDVRDPAAGASARLDGRTTARTGEPVVLVAAACLGGDSPTGLVRALRLTGSQATPVTLDPGRQSEAAASACRYPSAG
ncbi:helix-turn-helix domain-containing protein [Micromonospora sp. NPDC050187]|uniref:helix-turn-helix domain-containing protein n=1 Tax=Micromonospora sp. NPDC050187 TaxID=3364277 RepID=UPI0037B0DFC1